MKMIKRETPKGMGYVFYCQGCRSLHYVGPSWTVNDPEGNPTVSPSVLTRWKSNDGKDMICHIFIVDGSIRFLADCTHEFAGMTLPMEDFPEWAL